MPRLSHTLIHRARQSHPCLVPLVRVCRDLPSALNELRWLQEHVAKLRPPRYADSRLLSASLRLKHDEYWREYTLQRLCASRGRGTPLQYLLGSEFFGSLELKIRRGVLIPRRETAVAISHLASLLSSQAQHNGLQTEDYPAEAQRPVKILDLCTGSGCIPLLLRHHLSNIRTKSLGIDISLEAVDLAKENEQRARSATEESACQFRRANVFEDTANVDRMPALVNVLKEHGMEAVDILLSNPPYVSPREYTSQTERSVRNYEPRIALVPPEHTDDWSSTSWPQEERLSKPEQDERQGDAFYPRLLHVAGLTGAKIFWCEVGGLEQAKRVAAMVLEDGSFWAGVQIWRDNPAGKAVEHVLINGKRVAITGHGHGRSVICWRKDGASWLGF